MRRIPAIAEAQYARSNTAELRQAFHLPDLFQPGKVTLNYWDTDRTVVGGVAPLAEKCPLPCPAALRAAFFLERRELGVINVGQPGSVEVDGQSHPLATLDCLYLGRGGREVAFASADPQRPAQFYLLSYPAHARHPTTRITHAEANRTDTGRPETANCRTICKYIYAGGVASCQLVMGLTILKPGSLWNTMPPHTHLRRSEVYFYFNLPKDQAVFHFAGPAEETRSLILRDREAVVSPPWSIHCGVGTSHYTFIWGMGGENQEFADIDPAPVAQLS